MYPKTIVDIKLMSSPIAMYLETIVVIKLMSSPAEGSCLSFSASLHPTWRLLQSSHYLAPSLVLIETYLYMHDCTIELRRRL